ncbi:MAG: glycosyltransferase family 4 protein [Myxococcota bacterium]
MLAPCPFPTHQGTQILIRHLATTLRRAGHEVHLITYGYGEYEEAFSFHLHRSARINSGFRSGPSLLKPAADAALLLTASQVVKAYRCDVLHVHHLEGLGVGALLKLQSAVPLIYHAHTSMGPELPTYFRAHMAQAFASVVGEVVDRTLPRAADAVITFDPDHKALHELYGVTENRLHVIPPGIDADELRGATETEIQHMRQLLGPGPWILYAGNPDGYQNLELLWQAFALVRQKRPDAKLLVATHHEPHTFETSLKQGPGRDGIVIHRHRNLGELRAIFAIADVAVCPRVLWAGAPIKLLNYMAANIPTVACKASSRHILPTENNAMVDNDPDQFANAILHLLKAPRGSHPKQRRTFERFRIEKQLPLYEEVYRRVLQLS